MERKTFSGGFSLKSDGGAGSFRATFATLAPAVDLDGDVTLSTAFDVNAAVVIGAYGHTSLEGALPAGKGVIAVTPAGDRAYVEGEFFPTKAGAEMRETLKGLGKLAQFSYSYDVISASFDPQELSQYPGARRILQKLAVHEISAVLLGAAGPGRSHLDAIKGHRHAPAVAERVDRWGWKALRDQLELKAIADKLELQRIWIENSIRQSKADDESKTVVYIEVNPRDVPPARHFIGNLVFAKACAQLGVSGVELRWFEPMSMAESIARKAYFVEFGIDPTEDGADESFREKPLDGIAYPKLKQVWVRSDIPLLDVVDAVTHEAKHAAEPSDADHSQAYDYGHQWRAWAKAQVNVFNDPDNEKLAARDIAEALKVEFVGDALERQFGLPISRPNIGSPVDSLLGRDPNAPTDYGHTRPASLGLDDGH